jgi:branched-chain amino acid transport system ATP-binding protein
MPKAEILLRGCDLTQRWGAVLALDRVSIALADGRVHAVIGTNGAGKSTLINILCGEQKPSGGSVQLYGQDVTSHSQERRARSGLGRSYQRSNIFAGFSVLENCRLAAQSRSPKPWALWQDAQRCPESLEWAGTALQRCGLEKKAWARTAGELSHGQKRQLEIAMCLATQPRVLLLDEPLAGMGAKETQTMLALLSDLRASHAILLVEHDMDAVFRIADEITVLVNGSVLACGNPADIRANAQVQSAYLGGPVIGA